MKQIELRCLLPTACWSLREFGLAKSTLGFSCAAEGYKKKRPNILGEC